MIVASDVAIAMWTMCSVGKPCQVNSAVRNGIISMPPPMPSSPAANPVAAPSSSSAPMNAGLIHPVFQQPRVMNSHSSAVTGVIDRRLPRRSDDHVAQCRVVAQLGERYQPRLLRARMSTSSQRGYRAWRPRRSTGSCVRTASDRDRGAGDFGSPAMPGSAQLEW